MGERTKPTTTFEAGPVREPFKRCAYCCGTGLPSEARAIACDTDRFLAERLHQSVAGYALVRLVRDGAIVVHVACWLATMAEEPRHSADV